MIDQEPALKDLSDVAQSTKWKNLAQGSRSAASTVLTLPAAEAHRTGSADGARRGDTRSRLLSAALRRFADHGYDIVTTADIAAECGVSQSVVLYHFATKENLWREAMRLLFARLEAHGPPTLTLLSDLDEIACLKIALRGLVETAARFPELGRVILREGSAGGERLEWLRRELLAPHYDAFTGFFAQAVASGKLRRCTPAMVMIMIHSAAAMLFNLAPLSERLLGRSPFDPDVIREQSDLLMNVFLLGLMKDGSHE